MVGVGLAWRPGRFDVGISNKEGVQDCVPALLLAIYIYIICIYIYIYISTIRQEIILSIKMSLVNQSLGHSCDVLRPDTRGSALRVQRAAACLHKTVSIEPYRITQPVGALCTFFLALPLFEWWPKQCALFFGWSLAK